jgi:hypothetical protein
VRCGRETSEEAIGGERSPIRGGRGSACAEREFGWVWDGWLRRAGTFQSVCVRSGAGAAPKLHPTAPPRAPSRPSTLAAGSCAALRSLPRCHRCHLQRLQPFTPKRNAAVSDRAARPRRREGASPSRPLPPATFSSPAGHGFGWLAACAAGHRIFSRRCVCSSLPRSGESGCIRPMCTSWPITFYRPGSGPAASVSKVNPGSSSNKLGHARAHTNQSVANLPAAMLVPPRTCHLISISHKSNGSVK